MSYHHEFMNIPKNENTVSFVPIKATLYKLSEFTSTPQKIEIWLSGHTYADYAQHKNVPYIEYKIKRKRTKRGMCFPLAQYNKFFVIKGWGHKEIATNDVMQQIDSTVEGVVAYQYNTAESSYGVMNRLLDATTASDVIITNM